VKEGQRGETSAGFTVTDAARCSDLIFADTLASVGTPRDSFRIASPFSILSKIDSPTGRNRISHLFAQRHIGFLVYREGYWLDSSAFCATASSAAMIKPIRKLYIVRAQFALWCRTPRWWRMEVFMQSS
jgi:hypothetical protein